METVKVFIRFRANEKGDLAPWQVSNTAVQYLDAAHVYSFDQVFTADTGQEEVFSVSSEALIRSL
jgi:hypothetical protein